MAARRHGGGPCDARLVHGAGSRRVRGLVRSRTDVRVDENGLQEATWIGVMIL